MKFFVWIKWQLGREKRLTCQFSPAIRASSRSSVFSRILALLFIQKSKIQLCDLSTRKTRGHTVPSHSYISRFPLVFLEVKAQDFQSPFELPESFLSVVVGQADLEELEWRVEASIARMSYNLIKKGGVLKNTLSHSRSLSINCFRNTSSTESSSSRRIPRSSTPWAVDGLGQCRTLCARRI